LDGSEIITYLTLGNLIEGAMIKLS